MKKFYKYLLADVLWLGKYNLIAHIIPLRLSGYIKRGAQRRDVQVTDQETETKEKKSHCFLSTRNLFSFVWKR